MSEPGAPAASGPVVAGIGEVLWDVLPGGRRLGGAPINFARQATALGARGVAVSAVGDDALGAEARATLQASGVEVRFVATVAHHPTGIVTVEIDANGEPSYEIGFPAAWDFIPRTPELMDVASRVDAVCFGLLGQRHPVSRRAIQEFLDRTRPACLRVLDVNFRGPGIDRPLLAAALARSNVVKMNDEELLRVADVFALAGSDTELIEQLARRFGLRAVAVTRGADGCRLFDRRHVEHPGVKVKVADTVGAGDAFTAALVVGLLRGDGLERVAADANAVAARVCEAAGAWNPTVRSS